MYRSNLRVSMFYRPFVRLLLRSFFRSTTQCVRWVVVSDVSFGTNWPLSFSVADGAAASKNGNSEICATSESGPHSNRVEHNFVFDKSTDEDENADTNTWNILKHNST